MSVCQPAPISGCVASIIYYDFTSAEAFAVNECVRALSGGPPIQWRGVQSDPTQSVPMQPLSRRALERLEIEIADAVRAVPQLRCVLPRGKPNTKRALQAVASVDRVHPACALQFRTRLFEEYWWGGADLSDVVVVRRAAEAAGVPPWVDLENHEAQASQVKWELQWKSERLGGVPRVIRPDGRILWGAGTDRASLMEFLRGPEA